MTEMLFGTGAYSLSEAGRLLRVTPTALRRWLFGYDYDHHGARKRQAPLWQPQYGAEQVEPLLGFRDLIEARVVRGLRTLKIGLPTIRECLRRAAELVEDDHPFSTRRFKTDGRRIFLERPDAPGEGLIDLKLRQLAFRQIVQPSFIDLDFDAEAVSRWWLLPRKRTIVLDPTRAFGQPIVAETGVQTARLAQAVRAEGSIDRVAHLFELKPATVRDALIFERQLSDRLVG